MVPSCKNVVNRKKGNITGYGKDTDGKRSYRGRRIKNTFRGTSQNQREKRTMLKRYVSKYKYCALGIIIGLVVLAFCCTLQFFIHSEDHNKSAETETSTVSEKLFHSVMDIIPEIVYISMFDGSVKYISDGIEKVVGHKPEEIYKTRNILLQLVHPE